MPTANEILAERIDRIETIPNRFINKVAASQQELYNELIIILSKLGLVDGTLELNAANMLRVDELMNEYYTVLRNGRYGGLVSGFLDQFNAQKALSETYNAIEFGVKTTNTADLVFNESKRRATQLLIGDDFKTNFINVVRDSVVSNIAGRATFDEMRSNLLELYTDTDRLPLMQNWVSQISSDAYSVSDRAYNNEVATDLGIVFGVYSGGLIKDSREFCVERDSKYYHLKEVQSWASIQQWQGRYRRTTPQNIVEWLGGYNCQHVFAYRSLINIPPEVIERNISNGNFKPTERERQLLNL